MTSISRRKFFATLAGAGAAAAGGGWLAERLWALVQEGAVRAPRGAGVETWVPSLCRLCPAGCGVRVRLVDGLPVGLRGNRTHPVTRGGLCPAALSGLQELVHPDRLRTPMRRVGPRGSGQWSAVSWEDALEQIAAALRGLRAQGRPEDFAVVARPDSRLTLFWLERVLGAYGSPNLILDETPAVWRAAWSAVAGSARLPAVDLANADFILSFGHELFETDGHPVWQARVWGQLRAPTAARPAQLAWVGTRISPSAARADLRLAIPPGQEAVLALGLAHILLLEDLVDREFLERWTSGWVATAGAAASAGPGFEELVRERFTPEEVSRRTGVPVSELFRLGRAFGNAQRPVALAGPAVLRGEDGLTVALAVLALNLVAGAVGRPGGYVAAGEAPLALPPAPVADAVAARGLAAARADGAGTRTLNAVGNSPARWIASLGETPTRPPGVLLVHGVDPLHEWPGRDAVAAALARAELLVAMVRVPGDTAGQADLLLPETSPLEAWGLLSSSPGLPFDYAGLQQPAVEPLFESRSFEDAWFDLARRVGGPAAAAVPPGSFSDWLPEATAGLFAAGRGTLAGSDFDERVAEFMEARGWKSAWPTNPAGFWEALRSAGAWVDFPRSERSPAELLGPGVERFAFWPAGLLEDLARLTGAPLAPPALYAGIGPSAPADAAEATAFPLRLLLFDTNTLWAGRTVRTPLLLEMTGHREDIAWDSWVEIHADTAARLGIGEGDRVRLESADGSLLTRAHVGQKVPPDVVAMPRGLGCRDNGRFARGLGANPLTLLSARPEPLTGAMATSARVRVVAA
jgi:anaerobic selenocysteine-containing dehydrogenase